MSSVFIVIFGLIGFTFGWFVYSRFIAEKIYRLDPDYVTPANRYNDAVDFVPTNKYVLWGSHFTARGRRRTYRRTSDRSLLGLASGTALGDPGFDFLRRRA